jgi:pimeloyl-ACP methyl ester carboxylesterase
LSGATFDSDEVTAYRDRINAAFRSGDFAQAAEEFVVAWCDGPRRSPDETPPAVRSRVLTMALATLSPHRDRGRGRELDPPAMERLAEVSAPTLAILGELDMPDIAAIVARIEAELPNARVEHIPGAAHMVNMERPEEVTGLIRRFLAEQ